MAIRTMCINCAQQWPLHSSRDFQMKGVAIVHCPMCDQLEPVESVDRKVLEDIAAGCSTVEEFAVALEDFGLIMEILCPTRSNR
jgi:hypothetical protein